MLHIKAQPQKNRKQRLNPNGVCWDYTYSRLNSDLTAKDKNEIRVPVLSDDGKSYLEFTTWHYGY